MHIIGILAIILLIVSIRSMKKKKKKVKADLFVFKVAGISYYLESVKRLVDGEKEYEGPCSLRYEKNNPVDPNAIAVYSQDLKVGYIAKKDIKQVEELFNKSIKITLYLQYTDIFFGRVNIYIPSEK